MAGDNGQTFPNRDVGSPRLILGVIFFLAIFALICGGLSYALLSRSRQPPPAAPEDTPTATVPAAAAAPIQVAKTDQFIVDLPLVEEQTGAGSGPEAGQIWKVIRIKRLGYPLNGQRLDLASFTRLDGQATVKAYCIDPGWVMPELGTEYMLNADGIFIPVQEPAGTPLQRFKMIQ